MKIALILILLGGPIGAVDVVYYHLARFQLYRRHQSRGENVTHLLRGTFYALAVACLLFSRPSGAWFWVMGALFAADFVNGLIDVLLEPASRAPATLPRLELVTHYVGATLGGAACLAFLIEGWRYRLDQTSLASHPEGFLPTWLQWFGATILLTAVGLVLLEAVLFLRHGAFRGSPTAQPEPGRG